MRDVAFSRRCLGERVPARAAVLTWADTQPELRDFIAMPALAR